MWTGLHGRGGCVSLLPDAFTLCCARTHGSLSLVFEISRWNDTTAQSRSEADVNSVKIVPFLSSRTGCKGQVLD